jgi:hypothetical protein
MFESALYPEHTVLTCISLVLCQDKVIYRLAESKGWKCPDILIGSSRRLMLNESQKGGKESRHRQSYDRPYSLRREPDKDSREIALCSKKQDSAYEDVRVALWLLAHLWGGRTDTLEYSEVLPP